MRTAEDKARRGNRIGSQDISAILELNPFRKPIDVYRSCVEGWEPEPTGLMEIGQLLEPVVLELYRRRSNAHPLQKVPMLISKRRPFFVDTPDGLAWLEGEPRAVEAKTVIGWQADEWGDPGTDEVPGAYLIQAHWHMLAFHDADEEWRAEILACDLPVLVGGHRFGIYTVPFDPELAGNLLEAAAKFHADHIVPRRPPPVDGSRQYEQFLRSTWPTNRQPLRKPSGEEPLLAKRLSTLRTKKAQLETEEQQVKNLLINSIADADGIEGDGWKITYRANKKGSRVFLPKFDWEEEANG